MKWAFFLSFVLELAGGKVLKALVPIEPTTLGLLLFVTLA